METKVTRHNFFRGKTQYERFTEHSPLCVEESPHEMCNCTKTVVERPVGEPESKTQTIDFIEMVGQYRMRLEMTIVHHSKGDSASLHREDNAVKFWVSWPRSKDKPPRKSFDHSEDEHAYFWLLRNDHLKVEVTGTGDHDDIDCTLGTVLFGNEVDVSTFFNGHSLSRVVDFSKLVPEDVWAHSCSFGAEAWTKLANTLEATKWREFRRDALLVRGLVVPANTFDVAVDVVRARLLESKSLLEAIKYCFVYLVTVVDGFQSSALRQDILKIDEEAKIKMLARSRRAVR